MFRLRHLFILLLLGVRVSADEVQDLRAAYQNKMDLAGLTEQQSLLRLRRLYNDRLSALFDQARAQGDLDLLTAVQAEQTRFRQEPSLPNAPDAHQVIRTLQDTYKQAADGFRLEREKAEVAVTLQMDLLLEQQQRNLTAAGKIDAALALRAEREALTGTADFLAKKERVDKTGPPPEARAPELPRDGIWVRLKPVSLKTSIRGSQTAIGTDGSMLVTGVRGQDCYVVTAPAPPVNITAVRLEVLSDPTLPKNGPGRSINGNFVLSEFTMQVRAPGEIVPGQTIRLLSAAADHSQTRFDVTAAMDGDPKTGWAIAPAFGRSHTAVFTLESSLRVAPGSQLVFKLDQQYRDENHLIGKFRLSVTDQPDAAP